ncbi:MAG: methylated-DNA--[protein]-cysteine S-methyltransferase [Dehalococcoidia bacterium]|nr:MAG: methylated-DNA--[protein]-cysteine S-methyltransferase [Dehalococcoidia bacterium]
MDYAVFSSRLGWMVVAGSTRGIAGVALPKHDRDASLDALREKMRIRTRELREVEPRVFGTLPDRLAAYMQGERVVFPDQLDTSGWTSFRSRVWEATRQIPYGETRSYSWVAATIGQPAACRAVGQALHNNPVPPLVPCHRVIGVGGALTGFGGGLPLKQQLLSLESRWHDSSGNSK